MRPSLFIFLASLMAMAGCAPVLIGGAAAAGYIVVTQDYVTASVDASYARVWGACVDEIRRLGALEKSFRKLGEARGTIQGAAVRIKISKLTEKTVDIRVSARKNMLPNTELAQAILAAILRNLR